MEKRHVRYRNAVPADLTRFKHFDTRSYIGLLANRLHANNQLEVAEYSPWLDFKALCEQLKILSSILKPDGKNSWPLSLQTKSWPRPTTDKRETGGMKSKPHAWNAGLASIQFLTWVPALIPTHHTQLPLHLFFLKSDQTFGGNFFLSHRQGLPLKPRK